MRRRILKLAISAFSPDVLTKDPYEQHYVFTIALDACRPEASGQSRPCLKARGQDNSLVQQPSADD